MKSVANSWLIATTGMLLSTCSAAAQAVVLLSSAYVTEDVVRLADLLPRGASHELHQACQAIELGRAPQRGSMRVYESARFAEILDAHPEIARQLAIPENVVVRRSGYPLNPAGIRNAIAGFLREKEDLGNLTDSALRWSSDITTAEADAALEVRAVHWDPGQRQLQFSLRCVQAASCRDFLVYLQEPENAQSLQKLGWTNLAKKADAATDEASGPILVEAGREVHLLMQGDGIQISLKVICLESGRVGQKIRVRKSGSQHVFQAEVVSSDLLWSRLES